MYGQMAAVTCAPPGLLKTRLFA